jgi:uncharacterized membrane protein YqaE (UPF0057 family)
MKRAMIQALAFLFPPLVVRVIGTKRQWYVNLALTACLYFPGSLHAISLASRRTSPAGR